MTWMLLWTRKKVLSGEASFLGSECFMAIGIFTGHPHAYRHDLESPFHVLLWVVICKYHEHDDAESLRGQPSTTRLWGRCSTNFGSVARNELVDMNPPGFSRIIGEFSAEFTDLKGLAQDLHEVLFPGRGGEIFTGSAACIMTQPTNCMME